MSDKYLRTKFYINYYNNRAYWKWTCSFSATSKVFGTKSYSTAGYTCTMFPLFPRTFKLWITSSFRSSGLSLISNVWDLKNLIILLAVMIQNYCVLKNISWFWFKTHLILLNPLAAKLYNLNFHPLEVVSRWRDPQLQVGENCSDLRKRRSKNFKSCWLMSLFIFNRFKSW